jgi:4-alpha-glucanotransferase
MTFTRSSGIILHPTSLPGPDGIGDFGPEAYRWIDFLANAGCSLWQVLPLGPTGFGDSPYQCFSAFAGNPYLISPVLLLEQKLLTRKDFLDRPVFPTQRVDFGPVINWKITLLDRAYKHFLKLKSNPIVAAYEDFCEKQKDWLNDFSIFMAIKDDQGGRSWDSWPEGLRNRSIPELSKFSSANHRSIDKHKFRQFLFYDQWRRVHSYANSKKIQIIGDIPIFVAYDSADAWSHPELFYLDSKGKPTCIAGVPPDYFSPTGQLWGNPLYRWSVHKKTGFAWWLQRVRSVLGTVDIIRLDHFRGFAGYWEVPANMPTAEIGRWVKGPGKALFEVILKEFHRLPILAEDLGEITPDVVELRNSLGLPGMKILQFAFASDPDDPFLPHNYSDNYVVYTGTHDNDTARGWYESAPEKERDLCRRYFARSGDDISWDMIQAAWSSTAVFALAPLQDLFGLGNEGRMNFPGKADGNWGWRFLPNAIDKGLELRLRETNFLYSRMNKKLPNP